jgi:internalin A
LFVFDSGLQLPPELFGENEEANVAPNIIAFLAEQKHGIEVDYEVKVILLGDGRCGKSSLARRLIANQFDPEEKSTHGIRLWEMEPDFESKDEDDAEATAHLNIWDFAGQDLYHNTHRLFLKSTAVYVICWTDHGDGADPESDQWASDHLEMGEDQRRDLTYWQDQIAALGHAPGMDGPPPVRIVRTKCDRDSERTDSPPDSQTSHDKTALELSAKTKKGFKKLKKWLEPSVAAVLGPKRRREIGRRPMGVKHALQILKDRNQAVYLASESRPSAVEGGPKESRIRPPHPFVTRAEFDDLVREHCPDGDYHRDPGLLLDFLHQSGFLYYNPVYLPERVILDQRWAINGIYTIFHREKCWKQLRNAKGRFTASELRAWAWDDEGFDADEQALFLEFMQACGICFLLLHDSETEGKEAVYLAPSALPDAADVRSEAAGRRGTLPMQGEPLVLSHETLSRDSVLQLLVQLGRQWRRAPVLWKWGGQFQSYRSERVQGDLTFIHLDWQPYSAGSYGGTLTLTQHGPDETFLAAILAECEKLDGFSQFDLPKLSIADPYKDRWERRRAKADLERPEARTADARSLEAHKPSAAEATGVEVGISYAGDHGAGVDDWTLLPDGSIEKWPRALAATLRAAGFTVNDYRAEQNLDEYEKTQGCKEYLDKLTSRDFLVAFLSGEYLKSTWCMYELMRIYKRMPGAGHDAKLLRIGAFPDARFSQSNFEGEEAQRGKRLWDYWRERLQKFEAHIVKTTPIRSDNDIYAWKQEAASYAFNDWMEFVRDDASLNNLIAALRGEWKCIGIDLEPTEADLQKWAEETAANTNRPEILKAYAIAAESRKNDREEDRKEDREHAKQLLLRAYELEGHGANRQSLIDALKRSTEISTLEDVRRELLEDIERQE